jgi:hypothetical protein
MAGEERRKTRGRDEADDARKVKREYVRSRGERKEEEERRRSVTARREEEKER